MIRNETWHFTNANNNFFLTVMKYMEMFGNCTQLTGNEYQRHSVELYSLVQREWQQAQKEIFHPNSVISSSSHVLAFHQIQNTSMAMSSSRSLSLFSSSSIRSPSLPSSPPTNHLPFYIPDNKEVTSMSSQISGDITSPPLPPADFVPPDFLPPPDSPPALPPKRRSLRESSSGIKIPPPSPTLTPTSRLSASSPSHLECLENRPSEDNSIASIEEAMSPHRVDEEEDDEDEVNPLEELDVTRHLQLKRPEEDGPEIRGGHVDALVVQATKANKNGGVMIMLISCTKKPSSPPTEHFLVLQLWLRNCVIVISIFHPPQTMEDK
ncbi:hypothetical protein J437_LFUL009973, partial [Ladona fulva]